GPAVPARPGRSATRRRTEAGPADGRAPAGPGPSAGFRPDSPGGRARLRAVLAQDGLRARARPAGRRQLWRRCDLDAAAAQDLGCLGLTIPPGGLVIRPVAR